MLLDEKRSEVEKLVTAHAGRRLPGERELAAMFGVSRPRLRAILDQLEGEGQVERRHGSGTYALDKRPQELGRVVLLLDAGLKFGDDPFVSRCVEQLQAVLQAAGVQCFIHRTGGAAVPRTDGIVALGIAAHEALKQHPLHCIPAVALFGDVAAQPSSSSSLLGLDDEDAGAQAAQCLIELGVRSVTFFGRSSLPAVRERLRGIKRALQSASVPLEVVSCAMNYESGFDQGRKLDVARDRQGIVASNDWLALGLQAGIQVRNADASPVLVSFDGLPVAGKVVPPIRTLAVPVETICEDALTELKRLQSRNAEGRTLRYALKWS